MSERRPPLSSPCLQSHSPWSVPRMVSGRASHHWASTMSFSCSKPFHGSPLAVGKSSGDFIFTWHFRPFRDSAILFILIFLPHAVYTNQAFVSTVLPTWNAFPPTALPIPISYLDVFSEINSCQQPSLVFPFGAPLGPHTSCFTACEPPDLSLSPSRAGRQGWIWLITGSLASSSSEQIVNVCRLSLPAALCLNLLLPLSCCLLAI